MKITSLKTLDRAGNFVTFIENPNCQTLILIRSMLLVYLLCLLCFSKIGEIILCFLTRDDNYVQPKFQFFSQPQFLIKNTFKVHKLFFKMLNCVES